MKKYFFILASVLSLLQLEAQQTLTVSFDVEMHEMPSFAANSVTTIGKGQIVNAEFYSKEKFYFFVTYESFQGWIPSTSVLYNDGYYQAKELVSLEKPRILEDLENVGNLKDKEAELIENDRRELEKQLGESEERQLYLTASFGSIEDCDKYLQEFPNGKYRVEIERIRLEKLEYKDYQLAINGTIEDCDRFLSSYSLSQYTAEVRISKNDKIEYTEYKRASRGTIEDCRKYLDNYPHGKYKESITAWKERLEKVAENRSITSWNLGDRICTEDNPDGTIQGVIEQWNENQSKVKIKIIGGYEGMYKGEDIFKGNMIWVDPEGWYKCIGDESINYEIPSMTIGGGTYDRTQYKYDVGSKVECRMWADGNSGYDGVVLDKKDGKYLVKVTRVIVSGFFSTNLTPSECSGHVRLMYTKDRLEDEGEGSIIWVSRECVE